MLHQDFEPFLCVFCQRLTRWDKKIGISLLIGPSHAAPQLVHLGQTEFIGAIHKNRICRRNIQTGFDDGGANQQIDFTLDKSKHHLFQCRFMHTPMSNIQAYLRNQTFQMPGNRFDAVDIVMNKKDLSFTLKLFLNGAGDDRIVKFRDVGQNRTSMFGRGGDDTDITNTHQGHMKGPRYRGCGQCQDIDRFSKLFQFLFVFDAESLFLINYD